MGRPPKFIMSDAEGAFLSKEVQKYLEEVGITPIITHTHAQFVERFIRTFKSMLNKRVEWDDMLNKAKPWEHYRLGILSMYNTHDVHSSVGITPVQASRPQHEIEARMNLTLKQRRSRKYPDLEVGDDVKLVIKHKHRKEHIPIFSTQIYKIQEKKKNMV